MKADRATAVATLAPPAPELDPSRVGRDGFLRLAFARRGRDTVLVRRAFTLPLQFLEPIVLADDGSVCVVLLNPTGGILGGDRLEIDIALGAESHVCLTTPSATRVHRTSGPAAEQATRVTVGPAATLEYVPDHLIPHAGARFEQTLAIELSPTARLILWDAFALGRIARGERWAFRHLAARVDVTCEGRPLFIDRLVLEGGDPRLDGLGGTEGLGYVGTFVAIAPDFTEWTALAQEIEAILGLGSPMRGSVRGAAGPLAEGGCYVRLLTATAYELTEQMTSVWALLRSRLLGLDPADLRKQ